MQVATRGGIRSGAGTWVVLVALAAWGAFLRFANLGRPGLWLDEILGLLRTRISVFATSWQLAAPDPEHGPLYHGLLALATARAETEAVIRAPFAAAGVASIVLIYAVGARAGDRVVGLLAAALLATSPIHVYYSRDAKPYALLVLELLVGLLAVLRLARSGADRRAYVLLLLAIILLGLTSAQGLWCTIVLLACLAVARLRNNDGTRPSAQVLLWCAGLAIGLALFFGIYGAVMLQGTDVVGAPPLGVEFLGSLGQALVSGYSESDRAEYGLGGALIVAIIGAFALTRRRTRTGLVITAAASAGYAVPVAALAAIDHGIRARYLLAALPGLVMLVAAGLAAVAALCARLMAPRQPAARAVAYGLFALCALVPVTIWQRPVTARALASKADWRDVARVIKDRARAGDLVLVSNQWAQVCLDYYLHRLGVPVTLASASESIEEAQKLLADRPGAFLVAGGYHAHPSIRLWMDRFFTLYDARQETIAVYYYPGRLQYLTDRATLAELARDERRLWELLGGWLLPGENAGPFLVEGWADTEVDHRHVRFRWIAGDRAVLYLPVTKRTPARLRVRARALPALLPDLSLAVRVNGTTLVTLSMTPSWTDFDVDLAAAPWRYGANVFSLVPSRTGRPSVLMPGSGDPRTLSVAIQTLAVE